MPGENQETQSMYVPANPRGLAGKWHLDVSRTTVNISHKAMWGLSTVRGTLAAVRGEGETIHDGSGTGTVTIDAASVDTANGKRDAHLRSADFFDVEHHPTINFLAQRIQPNGDGTAEVTGELTAAGTTRPVAFTALVTESADGGVLLVAEVPVDRTKFGMTWNNLGMLIGMTSVSVKARFDRVPQDAGN
jgi:polyisoprenoid-binding protein YceI